MVQALEVDLVDQDARADRSGKVADGAELLLGGQRAGGVVQVAEDDEPGVRGEVLRDFCAA